MNRLKDNLIDPPGHADVVVEVERSLRVLDGVVLVVSAVEGVQPQTRRLVQAVRAADLPLLVVVNRIDRLGTRGETRSFPGSLPGRFNTFGLEFHRAYGKPDSPALEARVRPLVWRRGRPDAVVDDHGFQSHEWCQPFSGSIPLYPSYWLARGLAYAYLRSIDDPDYPPQAPRRAAARADGRGRGRHPGGGGLSRGWTERYATFGNSRAPELFPVAAYRDMVCYLNQGAVNPNGDIADPRNDYCPVFPGVTAFALVTEIADETAQGHYMDLCVRAHEAIDWAAVRLLTEADQRFEQVFDSDGGAIRRWMGRRRPVRP